MPTSKAIFNIVKANLSLEMNCKFIDFADSSRTESRDLASELASFPYLRTPAEELQNRVSDIYPESL